MVTYHNKKSHRWHSRSLRSSQSMPTIPPDSSTASTSSTESSFDEDDVEMSTPQHHRLNTPVTSHHPQYPHTRHHHGRSSKRRYSKRSLHTKRDASSKLRCKIEIRKSSFLKMLAVIACLWLAFTILIFFDPLGFFGSHHPAANHLVSSVTHLDTTSAIMASFGTTASSVVVSSSDSSGISTNVPPAVLRKTPSSIPLPLPPQKVSVVLINYSRPRMIRDSILLRTLLSHPSVDEVMLLHANPKTAFEFVHPKVVNIDATAQNDEMGLSLRFYFCQLAKNDWIIHVDDDMEFYGEALNDLLIEFGKNPQRIVGRFGRNLQLGNSFRGYSSQSSHKETEVILTKLMVMERNMCWKFFDYASLIFEDVILSSGEGPLWNGEDIFMSLVANHVYGSDLNNYAMDWLDVWQASDSLKDYDNGKLDISGGMKGIRFWDWHWWQSVFRRNRHYSYRGQLWQTAKKRLAQLDDVSRAADPI